LYELRCEWGAGQNAEYIFGWDAKWLNTDSSYLFLGEIPTLCMRAGIKPNYSCCDESQMPVAIVIDCV